VLFFPSLCVFGRVKLTFLNLFPVINNFNILSGGPYTVVSSAGSVIFPAVTAPASFWVPLPFTVTAAGWSSPVEVSSGCVFVSPDRSAVFYDPGAVHVVPAALFLILAFLCFSLVLKPLLK